MTGEAEATQSLEKLQLTGYGQGGGGQEAANGTVTRLVRQDIYEGDTVASTVTLDSNLSFISLNTYSGGGSSRTDRRVRR